MNNATILQTQYRNRRRGVVVDSKSANPIYIFWLESLNCPRKVKISYCVNTYVSIVCHSPAELWCLCQYYSCKLLSDWDIIMSAAGWWPLLCPGPGHHRVMGDILVSRSDKHDRDVYHSEDKSQYASDPRWTDGHRDNTSDTITWSINIWFKRDKDSLLVCAIDSGWVGHELHWMINILRYFLGIRG